LSLGEVNNYVAVQYNHCYCAVQHLFNKFIYHIISMTYRFFLAAITISQA